MLATVQFALVFNPILAAGLAQALRIAAGIIHGTGLVSMSGGLIGAAVSAIRPESPNLAAGQGGGNEPPARTKKKEKQTPGLRMDAPGPRRSVDDGLGKLPDGDFRAPVKWPTPTPATK